MAQNFKVMGCPTSVLKHAGAVLCAALLVIGLGVAAVIPIATKLRSVSKDPTIWKHIDLFCFKTKLGKVVTHGTF